MKYWIKERHNLQLSEPYYVACGQMSHKEARKKEGSLFGANVMIRCNTKKQYEGKLSELRRSGFNVYES